MTYTEAVALRTAIEASLLSGAGTKSVTIGDRTITYSDRAEMQNMLAQLNRDIENYDRRTAGQDPSWKRPRWR